jgi:hypothetical protein
MTFIFVVIAIMVIAAAALLITGRWNPDLGLSATGDYRPDLPGEPQFDLVIRGYRMDEVDAKIDELQQTIESLRMSTDPASRKAP